MEEIGGCVTGVLDITFDDNAHTSVLESCLNGLPTNTIGGTSVFKPAARLSEFIGATDSGEWTLLVQDMRSDNYTGAVLSWSMDIAHSDCVKEYSWTDLTHNLSYSPSARYGSQVVVFDYSFFLYGGYDINGLLQDLYRYDTRENMWTELSPVRFTSGWNLFSTYGVSYVISPLGLIAYGGLDYSFSDGIESFEKSVRIMDPVTEKWRSLDVDSRYITPNCSLSPNPRYLSASAYISASSLKWLTDVDMALLYTPINLSDQLNKIGTLTDSLLIFGGSSDSSGSAWDASQGGSFNDVWMLRLVSHSTPPVVQAQREYLQSQCIFYQHQSINQLPCISKNSVECSFRDLIGLSWCQTFLLAQ
jgi:hypothetical protein